MEYGTKVIAYSRNDKSSNDKHRQTHGYKERKKEEEEKNSCPIKAINKKSNYYEIKYFN